MTEITSLSDKCQEDSNRLSEQNERTRRNRITERRNFGIPQLEQYDFQEPFPDYIARNNEAIFRRYAAFLCRLLSEKPEFLGDYSKLAKELNPKRTIIPPLTPQEQDALRKRLDALALTGVNGKPLALKPKELQEEISKEISGGQLRSLPPNYDLRGTGEKTRLPSYIRKIYINPDIRGIDRYIESFYKILERNNIPIYGAKIHTEDFTTAEDGSIIEQAHNTMVIYIADDSQTRNVMLSALKAEQESGVPLAQYDELEVIKTALVGKGKILVGVDTIQWSFDGFSTPIGLKVLDLFKKKRKENGEIPNFDEVFELMADELKFRTGKKPSEYLSASTTT